MTRPRKKPARPAEPRNRATLTPFEKDNLAAALKSDEDRGAVTEMAPDTGILVTSYNAVTARSPGNISGGVIPRKEPEA